MGDNVSQWSAPTIRGSLRNEDVPDSFSARIAFMDVTTPNVATTSTAKCMRSTTGATSIEALNCRFMLRSAIIRPHFMVGHSTHGACQSHTPGDMLALRGLDTT